MTRRALLGLAASTALPAAAGAQAHAIRGTAAYRERMALPPGAVLEVVLEEISRADAPATRIAEARIEVQGQVPIAFVLPYDPARIAPHLTYAVRATLSRDGQVLFRTDAIHPVLTRGHDGTVELRLVRAAGAATPEPPPAFIGPRWVLTALRGAAPTPGVETDITFTGDGNAFGSGGCNRFRGGFRREGAAGLSLGPVASTMMACEGPKSEQEQRFHAALGAVKRWRVEGEALLLSGADGTELLRFRRA